MEHCSGKDHSGESVQPRWSNVWVTSIVASMLQHANFMCDAKHAVTLPTQWLTDHP